MKNGFMALNQDGRDLARMTSKKIDTFNWIVVMDMGGCFMGKMYKIYLCTCGIHTI